MLECYDSFGAAYKRELHRWIKSNDATIESIIEKEPNRVLDFATKPEEIRKILVRNSFCLIKGSEVVAHLLEAGKVTQAEKEEFFDKVLNRLYKYDNTWHEEQFVTDVFIKHGLFERFLDSYFDRSFTAQTCNMSKIYHSVSFYSSMICALDINTNDKLVRKITEVFESPYPYTLKDWFKRDMMGDATFASDLQRELQHWD